ncbi:MAG: hypothetical protein ACJA1A_001489 [Saprospiraceae bacterium]|jgi:hypothetical protein
MKKFTFPKKARAYASFLALNMILFVIPLSSWGQINLTTSRGTPITLSGFPSTICGDQVAVYTCSDCPADLNSLNNSLIASMQNSTVQNRVRLKSNTAYYPSIEINGSTTTPNPTALTDGNGNPLYFFPIHTGLDGAAPYNSNEFFGKDIYTPGGAYAKFNAIVQFPRGALDGYLIIPYRETSYSNGLIYSTTFIIPFVVEGPIASAVEVLGTTVEPQLPYMILHAPPGDESNAAFVQEKTTCRALQTNATETSSTAANLAVKLGVKGSIGFINTIDYEFSVTLKGGVTTGDMVMRSTDKQTCITINNSFMTSELTDDEGGGDIFIGYGTDLEYGVYDYIHVDEANCTAFVDRGLIYAPTGNPRQFIYNKSTILSEIAKNKSLMEDTINSVMVRNNAENQMDVWEQVLDLNLTNINNPDNAEVGAISFSGGNAISSSRTVSIVETNSINYENYLQASAGVDVVINIGGSGIAGGFEYKSAKKYGESQTQSESDAVTIKYTLNDDEGGNAADLFNVDIFQDPMFGTPIFKVGPSSRTSCPYQGGYQRDQPLLNHDGTSSTSILLENNPILSSATFKIDLCNESDEERDYNLKLNAQSNLNGAVVSAAGVPLNGNDLGQNFSVPAQSCVEDLVVEVKMLSVNSPLKYPDLELFLYSECEESIQSSVFASIYFGDATSTEDINATVSAMTCYPNPVTDVLNIAFDLKQSDDLQLFITDMMGRVFTTKNLGNLSTGSHNYMIETASLTKGIYTVSLQSGEGVISERIVVN